MQTFALPDDGPLQGLVASRIETYGGRHRATTQNPAGSLYPRGGPVLVSPGCPQNDLGGAEGGYQGFQVYLAGSWAALFLSLTPTFFPGL